MDIRFYLSLFLRRLHWFLLFLIIGSALGLTLAKVLPPVYVAKARLLMESEQIPGDLAASTVQTEATEQMEIIQQRILTRDTLLDLANRLNIYAGAPHMSPQSTPADTIVNDMRKRIAITTTGGNTGSRNPVRATLVAVSFEAPTGELAATVTNELVTRILREDVAMRTGSARQTLEFFEQEVSRLDAELTTRGGAILTFQEANQETLPDSLEFRRAQQTAGQERLLQMDRDAALLAERRRGVVAQQAAAEEADTAVGAVDRTQEQRQLQTLRDDLARADAILSPENPRRKLLQTQVDALAAVVAAQSEQRGVARNGVMGGAFVAQLGEIDAQLAFLDERKLQVQAELARLQTTIEATPGNAIALDTLQRDYANVRAQYDLAVANRARAETGDVIETLAKGQRISVIEQAVVPASPDRPNRKLIAAAGVGGGLFMGLAMVILLELLNKGIRRPADLNSALGITPFATLPYFRTTEEKWRRRVIIYGVLGALLVGIPIGIWALDTYYMPLDLIIDGLGRRIGLANLTPTSLTSAHTTAFA